jgi:hypothetical protein
MVEGRKMEVKIREQGVEKQEYRGGDTSAYRVHCLCRTQSSKRSSWPLASSFLDRSPSSHMCPDPILEPHITDLLSLL